MKMKKIFKLSSIAFLLVATLACENDDQTIVQATGGPELLTPTDGNIYALSIENENAEATTLVWNHASYDEQTMANYSVEIATAGTEFATIIDGLTGDEITAEAPATTTTNRFAVWTVDLLNTIAINTGIEPFTEGELEIRIKSSLGANTELVEYSNIVKIKVTPYVAIEPETPVLFLVGSPQGYYGLSEWTPTTAMEMRYIGDGTTKAFEAYVKVAAGNGFKFISEQADWGDLTGNYGTIGGAQNGNLENSGGSGDIKVAETDGDGLYYIQVDIDNLTYKAVKMNWGIIGDATAGGWNDETPMTYDFATNKYSLDATLSTGGMKFRSSNTGNFIYNDAWKFNVGVSDPTVTYNGGAGNFPIAGGSYTLGLIINFDGTAVVSGL